MKDKLFEGSLGLRPHAQGVWDFEEKQQAWAAGRDAEPPSPDRSRLGWTPRGLPWTRGAVEVDGTGGRWGTALLENTLRAPDSRPQVASGLMHLLSLEQTSPHCNPGLPVTPRAASGEATSSSNLCLLICETGVTTPSVCASQGCKDHMRKFWSAQRLCLFLFCGDHPQAANPASSGLQTPPPCSPAPHAA